MKKFSRKSEVQPVVDQKKPGVGRNSFRFDDEPEFPTEVWIAPLPGSSDMITELARLGAKKLLAEALECEIAEYLAKYESIRDEHGHKQVVRNGHCKERSLLTGVGDIEIHQPRVRDISLKQKMFSRRYYHHRISARRVIDRPRISAS